MDKSLNQAGKPHIIIVIDAVNIHVGDEDWNTDVATRQLLQILDNARFRNNNPLKLMADRIVADGGPHLDSIGGLMRYFYASVTVVRLPQTPYLGRMETRVRKLYRAIESATGQSYGEKSKLGVAVTADGIQPMFSAAADQFSKDMDAPFHLLAEAWRGIPGPKGMAGGLQHFICAFRRASRHGDYETDTVQLLNDLGPLFSSCLLLDAERHSLLGTPYPPRPLPPRLLIQVWVSSGNAGRFFRERYLDCLKSAFHTFSAHWLPCAFGRGGRRCRNFHSTHAKGHQRDDGKVMGITPSILQANFDPTHFLPAWTHIIEQGLARAQQEMLVGAEAQKHLSRRAVAALIHRRELTQLLASWMKHPSDLVSYKFCLFCACRDNPEHPLPCGHVLCTACVETFRDGNAEDGLEPRYAVRCPFHPTEQAPAILQVKPTNAGVRILCLDG